MLEGQDNGGPGPKRRFSRFVRAAEFCGLALAALGVLLAAVGLWHTAREIEASRIVREASLRIQVTDLLNKARSVEKKKHRRALRKYGPDQRTALCNRGSDLLSVKVGQVYAIESMVQLGLSLRHLEAQRVNLVRSSSKHCEPPGISLADGDLRDVDFSNVNLKCADFSRADITGNARIRNSCLHRARFVDADLINANLSHNDLRSADFTEADLSGAKLEGSRLKWATFLRADLADADFTSADLSGAKGLTQDQLDKACASIEEPPILSQRGNLKWKPRNC